MSQALGALARLLFPPAAAQQRVFRVAASVAAGSALAVSLVVLWIALDHPVLDGFAFRQAQTAITVYWLLAGGPWLAYETPVLGPPWSIPFEFPLYQWLVALFAEGTTRSIDVTGRLVSYGAFLLCFWPLWVVFKEWRLSPWSWLAAVVLTLSAPLYLFWSRTVMIESTALLCSLAFLAFYLRWLRTGIWWDATGAGLFAGLAMLTKVTTAVPFGLVAALWSLGALPGWYRKGGGAGLASRVAVAVGVAASAVLVGALWVQFADGLKAQNPFGVHLTSEALVQWNFGTLAQRTGSDLLNTVRWRAIPEALGALWVAPLLLLLGLLQGGRVWVLGALLMVGWLSAFLIFTNVHVEHNYYQYANAIFLTAAAGMVLGAAATSRPRVAAVLLVVLMTVQLHKFSEGYALSLSPDRPDRQTLMLAQAVRESTPPGSAIIAFGFEWSSALAYYAERKALMMSWLPPEGLRERLVAEPRSLVAPLPLSVFVFCPAQTEKSLSPLALEVAARLPVSRKISVEGCELSFIEP